jgi:hypothetical protein
MKADTWSVGMREKTKYQLINYTIKRLECVRYEIVIKDLFRKYLTNNLDVLLYIIMGVGGKRLYINIYNI